MQQDGARARQRNVSPQRSTAASAPPPTATQYSRERYVGKPGGQGSSSVAAQRNCRAQTAKPVQPRTLLILAGIAVVLLAFIIVRFVLFGPTASEYGSVKSQIDQQNAQIAQLQDDDAEMQAQIDSMQPEIETYNASGKK